MNNESPSKSTRVAYFSMEIALEAGIPTYSGGLGVLAGDMLRSAADLGVPMVGITLIHRRGYFRQRLDPRGNQFEDDAQWNPEELLEETSARASVEIEGRQVHLRAWKYSIQGLSEHAVPVYLLDSNLAENTTWDRTITDHLYGGDVRYRLCQEALLGIGGVRILRELGYAQLTSYHMNEGHAALLALGLLEQRLGKPELSSATAEDIEAIRSLCVFTTHTPVPAGHDQFSRALMQQVLGAGRMKVLEVTHCCPEGTLNMTYLALKFSRYINGVAMHHGEISQEMFPLYPIRAITNGVHSVTWTAPAFRELYDRHIPEWRRDNLYLRYVRGISLDEIRKAHAAAKCALLQEINSKTQAEMDEKVFTIGFARRAASYKRPELLLTDGDRLRRMTHEFGRLQVVFGGKAHPQDGSGKELIRRVTEMAQSLKDAIRFVYIPDYDMRWAQLITSGADLWLNTPQRPQEASGTSGMKAALNGVPSLSVLDGWWIEGHAEGATGWAIGAESGQPEELADETASLYDKLEQSILPMFYRQPLRFAEVMRSPTSRMPNGQRGERRSRAKRRDRKSVMEHTETGRARTRTQTQTLLRTWAGIAAIFFLTEFFAVVAPLRGQSPSGKAFDPFASVQQRLEVAADEQLARLPSRPIPNAVPRGSEFSLKQEETFVPGRRPSAEQRFQILGIDGGGIFRAEGVPVGLLRIAEVESNWKPFALSSKGAFGLWQLMPATARRYGLRVDSVRDDRADMDKSTRAAARYLRDLHLQFGDWALTLAAYNAGERAVQKAMERGGSNDFDRLSRRKLLPAETRAYVPAVLGSFDLPRSEKAIGLTAKPNAKFVQPRIVYAGATRGDRL